MVKRRGYDSSSLTNTSPTSRYVYKGGVNWAAVIAWLLGILVGLAFTVSPWFSGPFAKGIFASSSLGYLIGFIVSALAYWVFISFGRKKYPTTEQQKTPVEELHGEITQ